MKEKVESGLKVEVFEARTDDEDGCSMGPVVLKMDYDRAMAEKYAEIQRQRERHRATWTQLEQVKGLLRSAFPLLDDDGLDENEHHCEWAIQQDRKRLHALLADLSQQAEPAPAQDEQAVAAVIGFYEGEREPRLLSWNVLPNGEHRLYTRPAQTEQRPAIQRKYKDWGIVRQSESAVSIVSGATYVTFSEGESDKRMPWLVDFLSSLLAGAAPTAQTEQQPATVPEGWKLVPLRDTTEMMTAAYAAAEARGDRVSSVLIGEIYRAMLYAAPIAQTAPQVPERLPVEPYQTVDRSSTNYKAGWNACRKAMLEGQTAPQPEQSELEVVAEVSLLNKQPVGVPMLREGGGWTLQAGEKLVRQSDHLAALSAVTAERDRLLSEVERLVRDAKNDAIAYRAVIERQEELRAEVEMLRKDADRWNYVRLQGDDTHWLNLLRVDLEDFGGNVNAAVDALIDAIEAAGVRVKE